MYWATSTIRSAPAVLVPVKGFVEDKVPANWYNSSVALPLNAILPAPAPVKQILPVLSKFPISVLELAHVLPVSLPLLPLIEILK